MAIIKLASDEGVKIGIENCPMFFSTDEWPGGRNLSISPVIWEEMFSIIPDSNFGLNYDPSHMLWQQMDYVQPLYEFKDRIHHIHLKDAKIYRNKLDRVGILATPLEYHSPKLPGLGDINWNHFFTALTDIRYRRPVCIEVEDKHTKEAKQMFWKPFVRAAIIWGGTSVFNMIQYRTYTRANRVHQSSYVKGDRYACKTLYQTSIKNKAIALYKACPGG